MVKQNIQIEAKKILVTLDNETVYYAKVKARIFKKTLSKYINDLILKDIVLLKSSVKRELEQ